MPQPKFHKGDIIIKQDPNWGSTTLMVTDIKMSHHQFPDELDIYQLMVLESPHRQGSTFLELATWVVDKTYKLKC